MSYKCQLFDVVCIHDNRQQDDYKQNAMNPQLKEDIQIALS
jgi:hypothetical protein